MRPEGLSEANRALMEREGWNLTGWSYDAQAEFNRLLDAARAEGLALPPPDVSRGLDREEVAVTRDHPMAVIIRQAQDDFLGGASRITDDMAMFVARRIIAALTKGANHAN